MLPCKKIDVFFDLWEHLPVNSAILYTGNGILSSPEMVKGETYTITVGAQSGAFEAS